MKRVLLFLPHVLFLGWFLSSSGSGVKLPPIAFPKLSDSYRANAGVLTPEGFRELKVRKESQTDWQDLKRKSSYLYRILAFEALSKCGHPHPEVVMVTNDPKELFACAYKVKIQDKEGRGINLHEATLGHEAYGVRRLIAFHEAGHIVEKDYHKNYSDKKASQERERNTDINGVKHGGCQWCAKEFATFWLQRFFKNKSQVDHIAKVLKKRVPESIDQITEWGVAYLDWFITVSKACLQALPAVQNCTHPSDLERALYVARIAKVELRSKACEYHASLVQRQQKKVLEEKKLREQLKKEKEEYDAKLAKQKKFLSALQDRQDALKSKNLLALARAKSCSNRAALFQVPVVNGYTIKENKGHGY